MKTYNEIINVQCIELTDTCSTENKKCPREGIYMYCTRKFLHVSIFNRPFRTSFYTFVVGNDKGKFYHLQCTFITASKTHKHSMHVHIHTVQLNASGKN